MSVTHNFGESLSASPEMLEVLPRRGDMIYLHVKENDHTMSSDLDKLTHQMMLNRFMLNGDRYLVTIDPIILEINYSNPVQHHPLMTTRSFSAVKTKSGMTVWSDSRIGLKVLNHRDNCVSVYLELAIDEFTITRR